VLKLHKLDSYSSLLLDLLPLLKFLAMQGSQVLKLIPLNRYILLPYNTYPNFGFDEVKHCQLLQTPLTHKKVICKSCAWEQAIQFTSSGAQSCGLLCNHALQIAKMPWLL
jgi:hypothetical protein